MIGTTRREVSSPLPTVIVKVPLFDVDPLLSLLFRSFCNCSWSTLQSDSNNNLEVPILKESIDSDEIPNRNEIDWLDFENTSVDLFIPVLARSRLVDFSSFLWLFVIILKYSKLFWNIPHYSEIFQIIRKNFVRSRRALELEIEIISIPPNMSRYFRSRKACVEIGELAGTPVRWPLVAVMLFMVTVKVYETMRRLWHPLPPVVPGTMIHFNAFHTCSRSRDSLFGFGVVVHECLWRQRWRPKKPRTEKGSVFFFYRTRQGQFTKREARSETTCNTSISKYKTTLIAINPSNKTKSISNYYWIKLVAPFERNTVYWRQQLTRRLSGTTKAIRSSKSIASNLFEFDRKSNSTNESLKMPIPEMSASSRNPLRGAVEIIPVSQSFLFYSSVEDAREPYPISNPRMLYSILASLEPILLLCSQRASKEPQNSYPKSISQLLQPGPKIPGDLFQYRRRIGVLEFLSGLWTLESRTIASVYHKTQQVVGECPQRWKHRHDRSLLFVHEPQ